MSVRRPLRIGRRDPKGFVLVLVLAMLVLTTLLSAGLARRSLALAMEAATREEQLQARWGRLSLQRAVLARAEAILRVEEAHEGDADSGTHSSSSVTVALTLGGAEYELLLADEDAKVDLNAVFRVNRRAGVERIVRQFTGAEAALPVRVRPFAEGRRDTRLPVFDSWGQVFDLSAAGPSQVQSLPKATENLTCWGSGRVNIRRASDEVLRAVGGRGVRPLLMERVVEARRSGRVSDLQQLFDRLGAGEIDRRRLEGALFAGSGCHSLWVRTRWGAAARLELHVSERAENGITYISSFLW